MKQLLLLLIALILGLSTVQAARTAPANGRVVDEQGEAVAYASVVLLQSERQVAGISTDEQGAFTLRIAEGEYTLLIQYLGYEPVRQNIQVDDNGELGLFTLKSSATQIEGVQVTGQFIRREADRFVVNVANSPAAIGKDGLSLLETAPGVWITDKKISINGKGGTKVYVNERELRLEPEQLLSYLRSLRADEIQKIEIVPTTGADYDADSAGGVIKITLKKRREDGLEGSVSINGEYSKYRHIYSPSGSINYNRGKLNLNASMWGWLGRNDAETNEQTHYPNTTTQLASHSAISSHNSNGGGSIGAVYELNDRHSIGAELGYLHFGDNGPNDSYTDRITNDITTRTDSRYETTSQRNNYQATFNYIWRIDTLGSTLKVLADYTSISNDSHNDNFSRMTTGSLSTDSTYRDNASIRYHIATATLALEKKFSPRWTLKAGAKYTFNDMRNQALYEYLKGEAWLRNDNQSLTLNYTENIAAAYGIVSANLNRWSFVAGLRAEYTRTNGKSGEISQDYVSLFPNANVSYSLSKDGAYSLIAQYARTIERPRFWTLNPQRMQISDYTYQIGNPQLNPAFKHDVSLALVLKHKYTLTAGVSIQTEQILESIFSDPKDPEQMFLTWVNYDKTKSFYASANLPFQLTKWWSLNLNATYMRQEQRIDATSSKKINNACFVNSSTSITLPKKFYLDFSYNYQNRMVLGTVSIAPQHRLNAAIKKRFFNDKFTASFWVNNILNQSQKVQAVSNGIIRDVEMFQAWNNINYNIGLTYNFKSGKAFKRRAVESGSAEEKGRL